MTPNNIVNMAVLKELDMIAITDHNAIGNVLPAIKASQGKPIQVIPGIEITTQEEAHLLGYFPDFEKLHAFYQRMSVHLPNRENRPDIFGHQLIFDELDQVMGEDHRLLMNAVQMSFDQLVPLIRFFGGVPVPAHVTRGSFSVFSQMGYLPSELPIASVEINTSNTASLPEKMKSDLKRYKQVYSSDAHYLTDILERGFFIELSEPTIDHLLLWLGEYEGDKK